MLFLVRTPTMIRARPLIPSTTRATLSASFGTLYRYPEIKGSASRGEANTLSTAIKIGAVIPLFTKLPRGSLPGNSVA